MKPDIQAEDRGELTALMEPLLFGEHSRHRRLLSDLALDLTKKSAGVLRSLHPLLITSLADLARTLNCYY